MSDVFARFSAGEVIGLVAVGGGVLIALVSILMGFWWRCRKADMEAGLKQEMLRQGKSADEIERILRASFSQETSDFKQELMIKAVNEGKSPEEIERLMKVCDRSME